jgi:hypothetical protein
MLVGLCRPRIVLPADFEARYTPEEAAWVLAHERAHLQRGDAVVNAIATGALCVFWFNPLTYLAVGWLRFDQDLAADALVLAAAGTSRRGYATALLKAQILCDSPWRLPVGCQWQSSHPLTERIATLGRPLPALYRRCLGVSIALALVVCSVCAVWATQPAPQPTESGSAIAAALKAHPPATWSINRLGKWKVCLITTSCWTLAKKAPPRLCPAGALTCAPRTARIIPLALYQRTLIPDR